MCATRPGQPQRLLAYLRRGTRLVAVALVGVALWGLWRPGGLRLRPAGWDTPNAALALPSLGAEVFFLDVPKLVRRGPARVVVVRLGGPAQFVPTTYLSARLPGPVPIAQWAKVTHAPLVFNAGQFDAQRKHLGWLKGDDVWLSRARKTAWKALLVSGPHPVLGPGGPLPWAQVVDLAAQDGNVAAAYSNVLQSMMLVDDAARVRVRASTTAACRTVVAEDRQGRILVLASEGAMTLADMARWLPQSGLGIVRAMNLDGGVESQLAVVTPELQLMLYGQYGSDGRLEAVSQAAPSRVPLPAVVAVYPGSEPPSVRATSQVR